MITTRSFIYALALAFALAGPALVSADTPPPNCDFAGENGPKVTAKLENSFITGGEFEIPRNYVKSWAFVDGGVRDALLLSVWRESFRPFTRADENSEEQRDRYRAGHRDQMLIVVSAGNPLQLVAQYSVRSQYGIPINSEGGDLKGEPLSNGLYAQRKRAQLGFSDVFLGRDGERITDLILCKRPGDVPSPNCGHQFEIGQYNIKISYPLHVLDHWKTYRDRAEAMILCFSTKMPNRRNGE